MAHTPKPVRKKIKTARNRGNNMVFFGSGPGKTLVLDGAALGDLIKSANSRTPVYLDPFKLHPEHPVSSSKTVLGLTDSVFRGSEQ